jgi:hypothetical protein
MLQTLIADEILEEASIWPRKDLQAKVMNILLLA